MNLIAPITVIHQSTDDLNVETSLFLYNEGKHVGKYAVRVKDLDVNEIVGITIYPSLVRALESYAKIVNASTPVSEGAV